MNNIINKKTNLLFLFLSCLFVTNVLIAEFIGTKIFSLEKTLGFEALNFKLFGVDGLGFNLTAGVLLWPIVFILTDIMNEYFGKSGVKLISFISIALILYAFAIIYIAIALAPNTWWDEVSGINTNNPLDNVVSMDAAFSKIFGQSLAIILASTIAFLISQYLDVYIFQKIKLKTGENKIWLRATGSTLFSQLIDSFMVLLIAFWILADWPLIQVLAIGTVNYIYKFFVAVILTPVIYLAHHLIDNYLGKNEADLLKKNALKN